MKSALTGSQEFRKALGTDRSSVDQILPNIGRFRPASSTQPPVGFLAA